MDLISVGENLRGSTMETRKKAPSEICMKRKSTLRELSMLGVGELDI